MFCEQNIEWGIGESIETDNILSHTFRNVRKFTKFLCYKGKIAKNVLNFLKLFLIIWNLTEF